MSAYELAGPWLRTHSPFGLPAPEHDSYEWYMYFADTVVVIERFVREPNRYIISQTWPIVEATTLEAICERALAQDYTLLRRGPERRYAI